MCITLYSVLCTMGVHWPRIWHPNESKTNHEINVDHASGPLIDKSLSGEVQVEVQVQVQCRYLDAANCTIPPDVSYRVKY